MCGIAGFVGTLDDAGQCLKSMADSLAHRGPDGQGLWTSGDGVHLAHRRLAIVDLTETGTQPMQAPSGQVVVFNGEIYNHLQIRQRLETEGVAFRGRSDTETLLAAWNRWGVDCLDQLVGMFAFALWEPSTRRLYLVRDRLGKKPLYLFHQGGFLAFASEAKALLTVPRIRTAVSMDPFALTDFLTFGYVLGEKSAWRGITRLPPAHWLCLDTTTGDIRQQCYWHLHHHVLAEREPYDRRAQNRFVELLDDAVRLRLEADVPVGCFLSGGLDSSAIAATAARLSPRRLLSFCAGFARQGFDETAHAQKVAAHLGLDHHRLDGGADGADAIERGLDASDEFFADTSLLPTWRLNQVASSHIKVALSGDGADEILAGYPTYAANRVYAGYRLLPSWLQAGLDSCARRFLRPSYGKVSLDYKLRQFLSARGQSAERAHAWWRVVFDAAARRAMLSDELLEEIGDYDPMATFDTHFDKVAGAGFLDRCLYVDVKTWLVDDILVKADRMSMAHGLEVRSPFLDHRLVEFCARLHPSGKMAGWRRKVVLRDVMAPHLPAAILARRKEGFGAPVAELGRNRPPAMDFPGHFRQNFVLDGSREDITYKSFSLAVLSQWMRRWAVADVARMNGQRRHECRS
ncbi:MAG: asparagine synthase (glutamine-hydrolyzing) [Magnetospirillum sp.]|nr:asparagine synthase (glutamine-hydrolyzing) [Magnetospirillum sp.]